MPAVWATGFEFNAVNQAYQASGWTLSGTIDLHDTTQAHQHPDGYGGGLASLSVNSTGYVESPATLFAVASEGTLNFSFLCSGTFQAGQLACAVLDQSLDTVLEVRAVDTGSTSRLALLHAGVTFATTGLRVGASAWTRIAAKWNITGGTITGAMLVGGRNVGASGSTTLTTGLTAAGLKWGSLTNGSTYHDHVNVWDERSANAEAAYWIQGLLPNGDDINGVWNPTPATANFYERIVDSTDGTRLEATNPTYGQFNLQNRANIDASWTSPEVVACTTWVQAQGDGSLQQGRAHMSLGGSTVAGLTLSMAQAAPGGLASVFSTDKPGGSGWAATDLDNLGVGYSVA